MDAEGTPADPGGGSRLTFNSSYEVLRAQTCRVDPEGLRS